MSVKEINDLTVFLKGVCTSINECNPSDWNKSRVALARAIANHSWAFEIEELNGALEFAYLCCDGISIGRYMLQRMKE